MTERPILFSAPMVRAILEGRKTMTRRVIKPQPIQRPGMNCTRTIFFRRDGQELLDTVLGAYFSSANSLCPYGQPGARLWVKETGWERPVRSEKDMREGADTWDRYYYDADGLTEQDTADFKAWGFKRRPSIHMPRWASRINLEITGVYVERLNEIGGPDCVSEGIPKMTRLSDGAPLRGDIWARQKTQFRELWESINGHGSWALNPWVWVVEFKRLT